MYSLLLHFPFPWLCNNLIMATERIEAYFETSKQLIVGKNWQKIVPELKKLATYLLKHQNETVPDGTKGKLLQAIEGYYRYLLQCEANPVAQEAVVALLGTYLQLPEGKLLSATIKKKVLVWYQDLNAAMDEVPASSTAPVASKTTWLVQNIDDKGVLTLLSATDDQLWKEDYSPANIKAFQAQISARLDEGVEVVLELDEATKTVVSLS